MSNDVQSSGFKACCKSLTLCPTETTNRSATSAWGPILKWSIISAAAGAPSLKPEPLKDVFTKVGIGALVGIVSGLAATLVNSYMHCFDCDRDGICKKCIYPLSTETIVGACSGVLTNFIEGHIAQTQTDLAKSALIGAGIGLGTSVLLLVAKKVYNAYLEPCGKKIMNECEACCTCCCKKTAENEEKLTPVVQ